MPIKLFDLFLSRTSLNSVIRSCLFQLSSYHFFKWGSRKNELHFITLIKTRVVVLLSSERRAAREKVKLCTPLTRAFDLLWPKRKIRVFSQSKSSVVYPGFSGVAQVPAGRDSILGGYSWEILVGESAAGFSKYSPNFRPKSSISVFPQAFSDLGSCLHSNDLTII